eukprot:TRINITY_DN92990_c0_g1_i1.p1 TRINITY_DN92990_c0_g1~~TRINITY_DN92990_c0_g1_i1.p1  ORF type:complete len:1001 (-),score=245.52 TRINITY_DN92990_c0_g1_i1:56-3058(-)
MARSPLIAGAYGRKKGPNLSTNASTPCMSIPGSPTASPNSPCNMSRPVSRTDSTARLSGAGRFVLGSGQAPDRGHAQHGTEHRRDGHEEASTKQMSRSSSMPWRLLMEDVHKEAARKKGKPMGSHDSMRATCGDFRSVSKSGSMRTQHAATAENWLCQVPSGLGAVQADARSDALEAWQQQWQQHSVKSKLQAQDMASTQASLYVRPTRVKGIDAPKQEWCKLSSKARRAIQSWAAGQIGGRHCLMLLEHDAAIDFFISPLDHKEISATDVGTGSALCALSGLPLEAEGSREGGWLYKEVFNKSAAAVLEEALAAAYHDAGGQWVEKNGFLTADQVNLSLRRRAMKAQAEGMHSLVQGKQQTDGPRCCDEFMRIQVWLELVRHHVAGQVKGSAAPQIPGVKAKNQANAKQLPLEQNHGWDDQQFLQDLGKPDTELEASAKEMAFETLCRQNQSMESYMMRLVRQRDNLKNLANIAEESACYLTLGLEGPGVSAEEVKKAYRTLALKEHPDKAGTDNKERFQEIQKAYASVVKQQRNKAAVEDGAVKGTAASEQGTKGKGDAAIDFAKQAASHAEEAKVAADHITGFAAASFSLCTRAAHARGLRKRVALRDLTEIIQQGVMHLRCSASKLRAIRTGAVSVSKTAEKALAEYGQWAASVMSGVGLQERAEIVKTSGLSCLMTADHLEEMAGNDENMLEMLANPECSIDQASAIRVLSESISRTATVIRCSADKAITTATGALELGCSMATLDRERRTDQAEKAAARARQGDESPKTGPDGDWMRSASKSGRSGRNDSSTSDGEDSDVSELDLGEEGEDGKPRQAKLRVRNLRWLESLNKEVLELQAKLRASMQQQESKMLKGVAPTQKDSVFELVGQLLHSALAEVHRLLKDEKLSSRQLLEQALAFALAVEHTKQVAVPAEVRTQVLKHAALLDIDLLCQIIEGPFHKRLASMAGEKKRSAVTHSRPKALAPGVGQSWAELVESVCQRIVSSLRMPLSDE